MDKLPGGEIKVDSKTSRWFDNFWYHYKWQVILSILAVLFLIFAITQVLGNEKGEITVLYAGPYKFEGNAIENMKSYIAKSNNDIIEAPKSGSFIGIVNLNIYTEEQIKSVSKNADEGIDMNHFLTVTSAQELYRFDNIIIAGEYPICLLDPSLFERVNESGGFVQIAELTDKLPVGEESIIGGCGIALKDLDFGIELIEGIGLPGDTVLCFRKQAVMMQMFKAKKAAEEYEINKKLFIRFLDYSAE